MARSDPHKWIGTFRASLNEVVATNYSVPSQEAALDILRRSYAVDLGVGPGWDEAAEISGIAGFTAGLEFVLAHDIALPPAFFVKLRSRYQQSWPQTFVKSDIFVPSYLVQSPSGIHPPTMPPQLVKSNQAMMRRLHSDTAMPVVSWKEMHGLAINANLALAFALMTSDHVDPIASPSSIKHMLQTVRGVRPQFTLTNLAVAIQGDAAWKPANFAQAVFSEWWRQAPCLAKRGDEGCAEVLKIVGAGLAPNDRPSISNNPSSRQLLSALLLLERSGYPPQQVFRVASRHIKTSLAALAITTNEPETVTWLVDRGIDLSGDNMFVDTFSFSRASIGLPKDSFWSAMIARLDLTAKRAQITGVASEQLEKWWVCIHGLLENSAANLALRTTLRGVNVSFESQDTQARWESVVGHVALQRTVGMVDEQPAAPRPSTRF